MRVYPIGIILCIACFVYSLAAVAQESSAKNPQICLTKSSVTINGVELRCGPARGNYHFISLSAAEKALGHPGDSYQGPRGYIYTWPAYGIRLQKGWRGDEKDKIFKFQIFFETEFIRADDKNTGSFSGSISVDNITINQATSYESIKNELLRKGYRLNQNIVDGFSFESKDASGSIIIFGSSKSGKIERVDAWCL